MVDQVMQERKVERMIQGLRVLLIVAVVAVIVGGGWLFIKNRSRAGGEEAFALLFQAEKVEQSAAKEAEAQGGDVLKVMTTWGADKKKDYEDKLSKVIQEYPKTAAAAVAGLRLGRFRFAEGRFPEAADAFKGVSDRVTSDDYVVYKAMALDSLATTFEAQKNIEEARKTFEAALGLKDNPLKPLAYLGQARSLKQLGKKDEAKAAYEKVIQEFPGSPYARKARALLNASEG